MTSARPPVALLTREYPPDIYGGAGVHVEYLARELGRHVDVQVHCWGDAREAPEVRASYAPWEALDALGSENAPHRSALKTLSIDLAMAAGVEGAALAHSHTWYANLAGHYAKLLYGIPHVMTTHSLEPLRPWKREQLGGGYALSSFAERTAVENADAVIAVSSGMKRDILRCYPAVEDARVVVIHNGIDPEEYRPVTETSVLERFEIDQERPYVVFVGRITRQKGVVHLLEAFEHVAPGVQLVLCAGEPDTPEIAAEVEGLVEKLRATRGHVFWIDKMLERPDVIQLLSHSRAFVCPSVYEPFGIVNLEAMACGAPVVASAIGGIPEIIEHGQTGFLVPFASDPDAGGAPVDRETFARDLAKYVNQLVDDPQLAARLGTAGRERVVREFSWTTIADRTAQLYRRLIG